MTSATPPNPLIIGLTGSFGSGCTYLADEILTKLDRDSKYTGPDAPEQPAYRKLSLSDALRQMFHEQNGEDAKKPHREALQNFGDEMRAKHGAKYFAEQIISEIDSHTDSEPEKGWVVRGIRNPAEIQAFRERSRNFFLFGIYADRETRWERVRAEYEDDRRAFDKDDKRDTGEDSLPHGQRVADCFAEADIVITNDQNFVEPGNDDFAQDLAGKVAEYAALVAHPLERQRSINPIESLMAMAYAASQRSSCNKRKVGAVIVDENSNVVSSGFNEVPEPGRDCVAVYRKCYRDWKCERFFKSLSTRYESLQGEEEEVQKLFRSEFKILDLCRALHAEELAILNFAKNGRSTPLAKCTLYTTTYPCRMCANKIVSVGIKRIVYLEPYPDPEAKNILHARGVDQDFFEGVTFKAYFRLYGEEK
ncbi:MAG: deaminase [Phycisphaerae bacterium]